MDERHILWYKEAKMRQELDTNDRHSLAMAQSTALQTRSFQVKGMASCNHMRNQAALVLLRHQHTRTLSATTRCRINSVPADDEALLRILEE